MTHLKDAVKKGESGTLEFKENFNKEVIETCCAFANDMGGTILIGVSRIGEIKGTSLGRESLAEWANQIAQSTEPSVIPEIGVEEVDESKVVHLHITESPIKPVSVKGRCFKRVGNSNRTMSPQEVAQMHLRSTGISWDALTPEDATTNDIDIEKVKKYIRSANVTGRRKIGEEEDLPDVLEKLELIKDGRPTWAAILLFGRAAQSRLIQAQIHCGRFKGETKVIDNKMIGGTVIEQVDEAMDFILKNMGVEFVMTGMPTREEIWDYPPEALREAVINAVCHRDYTQPSYIEIRIHDDDLIVWSPGSLPDGITLEDLYRPHLSVLRNKKIAGIFYDLGLIEQWGSGIDKMRKTCLGAGLPEPVFEEYQGFRVTFRRDRFTEDFMQEMGLNERQIGAVTYVKEKGRINNKEYRSMFGITDRTALRDLTTLCEAGILKKVGITGRKTEYVISRHKPDKPDINPTETRQSDWGDDG
jgi:ATP-dependent DNA helicase RecG